MILSGYLESFFGVYSVRIENAGVRRPPSDDLKIQGITNPSAFRKVNVVPIEIAPGAIKLVSFFFNSLINTSFPGCSKSPLKSKD